MRIHVIFHMTKFANIEMEEESQFFFDDDIPSRRRKKKS